MVATHQAIVERFAVEAIRLGAESLEVACKDGCEKVFAAKGGLGVGLARIRSSSPEAATLREELRRIVSRKRRIAVAESQYELRGSVYESFGEDAFRVEIRPL
jgi:hypothetical protein